MTGYTKTMRQAIELFTQMPGIGTRTAERIAFYLLSSPKADVHQLAQTIIQLKEKSMLCSTCFNLSEGEQCAICAGPARDHATICVVEQPKDVILIEKAGGYHGVYHVLLGALSPLDGIGPDEIKIRELLHRVKAGRVNEVILATSSHTEGDATALYLERELGKWPVKVSRIGFGLPMGASLEMADQATLAKAIESRRGVLKEERHG